MEVLVNSKANAKKIVHNFKEDKVRLVSDIWWHHNLEEAQSGDKAAGL